MFDVDCMEGTQSAHFHRCEKDFIDVKRTWVKLLATVTGSLHEWSHAWGFTVCNSIALFIVCFWD